MTDRAAQFRRFYRELRIEDQRRFDEARRTEYRSAHEQLITVRNVLLVAAALAGGTGQLTGGTGRASLAVVAAVLAALAGAVAAYGVLIGYPQLSKLYTDVALNLAEAEIDWGALDPNADPADAVERVEGIFLSENGRWGQLVLEAGTPPGEPGRAETPR